MIILYLKDNNAISCYVGAYENVDKFIELIKINYPLDTFNFEDKNGKLLIERYFRGNKHQLISKQTYSYKHLKLNSEFVWFK